MAGGHDIGALKDANKVEEIIGRYIKLTRKGPVYVGLCPFHNETSPSFTIYPLDGHWHCFGCGTHGDVIDFVAKRFAMSFQDACHHLNGGGGLPKPAYVAPKADKIKAAKPDTDKIIMPAPANAPTTIPKHALGDPAMVWDYRDGAGALLYRICRFNKPDGGKEFFPLTYRMSDAGRGAWRWKSAPQPRPIYGLDRLAARPRAPVVVTEGEKAADAAGRLLPDHVAISWSGGAAAVMTADWTALEGRVVLLWPDADEPGRQAMERLAAVLADHVRRVEVVRVPTDVPKGWDAADAAEEAVDVADILANAERWRPAGSTLSEMETVARPDDAPDHLPGDDAPPSDGDLAAPDERPEIIMRDGDLHWIIDEAEEILIKADLSLYQRGSWLVLPGVESVTVHGGTKQAVERIFEASSRYVAEIMTKAILFKKWDARSKGFVGKDCPEKFAETYMARRGKWNLPVLAGLATAPTLRPDGSVLATPGYDRDTGLLFLPGTVEFPKVPTNPSRTDALEALNRVLELVDTFPFVEPHHRSIWLSAMLSACIRRSLPTVPMHAFDSPVAGSGKSMLVDIVALIATGHRAPVMTQGRTEEEMEKRLGSALLAGSQIVSIDNCEHPLGGDLLSQMLSQPKVSIRVLGKSNAPSMPTNCSVFATGNNLVLVGDITRRALVARIDPQTERPELRNFATSALERAESGRPEYLVAALTILSAYHAAGYPGQPKPLGGFEEWSNWVRAAILWLGQPDPVAAMEETRAADPRRLALSNMLQSVHSAFGETKITAREMIERAEQRDQFVENELVNPDLREALLTIAAEKAGRGISSVRLGIWLGNSKDRVVAGLKFQKDEVILGFQHWRVIVVNQQAVADSAARRASVTQGQPVWPSA